MIRTTPLLLISALLTSSCIKRELRPEGSSRSGSSGGSSIALKRLEGVAREPVLGAGGIKEFELQGAAKEKVETSVVPVTGQPFTEALRAKIKEASGSEWSVQVQALTKLPVKAGDSLLATFYVRATEMQEAGKAETQFVFERAAGPYTKSITYPLFVTSEWRKVHVRFTSKEDYAPGQAQMIFRLGYEPETIEIAGVTVENFGKDVKVRELPSTEVADLRLKPKPKKEPLPNPVEGGEIAFDVTPGKITTAISPYVYGINSQPAGNTRTTVRRMGGNRQTVYNWEINASNAGQDYKHQNDDWPCSVLKYRNCTEPGGQFSSFIAENSKAGIDSLVVVPLIDWVSADKSGPVEEAEKAPSKRFLKSLPKKPGPLSLKPDLSDGVVYQDEFVNLLVTKHGRADKGGAKFYALDNEPALWPSTHPRVHPDRTTYKEIVSRSEALAAEITRLDPSAIVLGAVAFGWSEFMSLSSAPDAEGLNKQYTTYLEYFLASMKALEQKHGRRLVHVLDVHWYPEMKGTVRITEDDTSLKTIAARVAAPRSLWDPEYKEQSWITDQWQKPIRLFPWLKELTDARYPGTKLALTEYNFGAGGHISGGLAQVDVLGILGREGVYLANYWGNGPGNGPLPPYIAAAFELFRNYDGKGGKFGESAVEAKAQDLQKSSIYAALTKEGRLTVLVINKDLATNMTSAIRLAGAGKFSSAQPFVLDPSGATIKALPKIQIKDNVIRHKLGRLSATLFVCEPG